MKKEDGVSGHWSRQKEKTAGYWHLKLLLILFKLLPVFFLRIIAFPVGFFYFVFSKSARMASADFMEKAANFADNPKTAKKLRSPFAPLKNIISFALTLLEKIQIWSGRFPDKNLLLQNDDAVELTERLKNGKGVLVITSHLGNIEPLRGLTSFIKTWVSREITITAVIDMEITENFSRMLKEVNPQYNFDIVNSREIGPHTSGLLEEKLAAGGVVAIAGDRTSANNIEKNLSIPFLGKEANFPQGVFYLAALMQASTQVPIYFVFALRRGDLSLSTKYDLFIHKNTVDYGQISSKKERFTASSELASSFAAYLETYCKKYPFQWYNFFDFWAKEV